VVSFGGADHNLNKSTEQGLILISTGIFYTLILFFAVSSCEPPVSFDVDVVIRSFAINQPL